MKIPSDLRFETYLKRTSPDWVRSTQPPPTWDGSAETWTDFVTAAREFFAAKACFEFVKQVSENGWKPAELATGELERGAEVYLNTGRVKRPPAPEITVETAQACQAALAEADQSRVALEPVIRMALEKAAWYRQGGEGDVRRKLASAQSTLAAARAEREAQRQEVAQRQVIRVHRQFEARGRTWAVGDYRLAEDVFADLEDWRVKSESYARGRGWDKPEGFRDMWPPYEVLEAVAA